MTRARFTDRAGVHVIPPPRWKGDWWMAPPIDTDRPGARAFACALLAWGVPFNRAQTIRLLALSATWKRGTPRQFAYDLRLLGALWALADRGGWRGLA